MSGSHIRYKNKQGKLFIPVNMDGGTWKENFITTPKIFALGAILFITLWLIMTMIESEITIAAKIVITAIWIFIAQLVIRYIVFEEKYYYKMYKELQSNEITTPSLFWNIAFIKDTDEGALLTYTDYKIGAIIKFERGTITGQTEDFKQQHYDAVADFYKELLQRKYKFVQLNIMEQSGNDPRIAELEKLLNKSDNKNIRRLMELEIGYIKSITTRSLYDSDYLLVYTNDTSKLDYIIGDITECFYRMLNGAFIGFRVLTTKEIVELVKEEYGVKYFNYVDATLDMYKNNGIIREKPFELVGINFTDKERLAVGEKEINYILKKASDEMNDTLTSTSLSLKDELKKLNEREKKEVDFGGLGVGKKEKKGKSSEEFLSLFEEENQGDTFKEKIDNSDEKIQLEKLKDSGDEEVLIDEDEFIDF